ncbi:MAG: hypothetical protein CMQ54_05050 [Gammaproteobacteria bacterium]|nr:hypothetical protein [Gammaproteobacteria bacterium]|tara:strand:- start:1875 stop:2057 length:183 start_codon:yes stop_codon:yes gene_type:complete
MDTSVLLGFAFVVFALLLTGLALTAREFLKVSEDPSIRKGVSKQSTVSKETSIDASADEG